MAWLFDRRNSRARIIKDRLAAERKAPELKLDGIFRNIRRQFAGINEAVVVAPPDRDVGAVAGCQLASSKPGALTIAKVS